jgi:hypothetical protein
VGILALALKNKHGTEQEDAEEKIALPDGVEI